MVVVAGMDGDESSVARAAGGAAFGALGALALALCCRGVASALRHGGEGAAGAGALRRAVRAAALAGLLLLTLTSVLSAALGILGGSTLPFPRLRASRGAGPGGATAEISVVDGAFSRGNATLANGVLAAWDSAQRITPGSNASYVMPDGSLLRIEDVRGGQQLLAASWIGLLCEEALGLAPAATIAYAGLAPRAHRR